MEIEQHVLEQSVSQKEIKSKSKSILRDTKMEADHTKTYGMQQKQFSGESLQINAYTKEKERS